MVKRWSIWTLSMLGIGTGLDAFGIGGGVAGITTALDKFDGSFGRGIYDNVVTLCLYQTFVGGKAELLKEGGAFAHQCLVSVQVLFVFGVVPGVGVGMGIANFGINFAKYN